MKKQIIALLLTLSIILGITACGGSAPSTNASTESEDATEAQASKPEKAEADSTSADTSQKTYSVMIQEFEGAAISKDMLIFQELEKLTGVRFDAMNVPGNEYAEKAQVTLASGNLPDMMETAQIDATEYINAGTFVALDDVLESHGQNILARYDSLGIRNHTTHMDGNIYKIATLTERVFFINNIINKTWLDAVEMDMPTSLDELYQVLTAFRDNAGEGIIPEGAVPFANGGYAGGWNSAINMVKKSYGIRDSNFGEYDDTIKFPPYQMQDRYKAALAWSAKAYQDGLLDQQMFSISEDELQAKYANGLIGFQSTWGDSLGSHAPHLAAAPVMSTEFGEGKEVHSTPITTFYMISKSCEDVEGLVSALDYLYSDEGVLLTNWGIEGETYEVTDGEKHFTSLILDHENSPTRGRYVLGMVPPHFPGYLDKEAEYELKGEALAEIETLVKDHLFPLQAPLVPTREENTEYVQIMTDISKFVSEQEPMFIRGELNLKDDFDAFIAQLEKMNIERAIEIKEAQLQRFQQAT